MDEKIEEMVLAVYPWLKEVPIEERKQLSENVSGLMVMERLYNAGYRKESDTAREILTDIITGFVFGWKADNEDYRNGYCQALTDYDEKIKSYIKEKYGVDLGE